MIPKKSKANIRNQRLPYPSSPGIELDLRGQRADDAEIALERYLDAAFLAGLPYVRIIHGKGTGKLRESGAPGAAQPPLYQVLRAGW